MSVNAQTLITRALYDLGVNSLGTGPDAFQGTDGLARLNVLVDSWATQTRISSFVSRNVFSLTSTVGSYTLGPGGAFNTPIVPVTLEGAGIIFNSSSPGVERPRGVLTSDAYQAIPIKSLTSTYFTDVYYQRTYTAGLGLITLWPMPIDATTQITLYWRDLLAGFADLTTLYTLPNGYERALEYNLAVELIPEYEVPDATSVKVYARATDSLRNVKRAFTPLVDLPIDPALTSNRRGGYDIISGTGSGS
jgi:hypothetical protein